MHFVLFKSKPVAILDVSVQLSKMFPHWIQCLLKFYDICGFYTESSKITSDRKKNSSAIIFLIHSVLAFVFCGFCLGHSMQPVILQKVLPYMVNELLQMTNGMFTYWVIILESYFQREAQREFWRTYKHIKEHHNSCQKSLLRIYLIKLFEFMSVVIVIQIIFLQSFTHYVGNYMLFRVAYLFSQTMYQYRVFCYIFYLELVKYELKTIKIELKQIVDVSGLHINFKKVINGRTKRCGSTMGKISENNLKNINAYFQLVYKLTDVINQIFGWSNFTTILYCFHLPLTDGNWAISEIGARESGYIRGNFFKK